MHGQELSIPGFARAYLATPDAPAPGVLVCHDWYGLLPSVTRLCDDLAAEGFVALAPSVYGDRSTTDPAVAEEMLSTFGEPWVVPSGLESLDHLRTLSAPGGPVFTVGFSAGGGFALRLACEAEVGGSIAVYGILAPPRDDGLRAPVQLHWAEVDEWEPPDAPARFVERLRERGVDVESFDYPGTQHSFFNAAAKEHDPEAATLAFGRIVGFLRRIR
jgi:carboxymethylenebutenolidase